MSSAPELQQRDPAGLELRLAAELAALAWDPLGFVMYAYPWRSEPRIQQVLLPAPWRDRYASKYGPDAWACDLLEEIAAAVRERRFDGRQAVDPIRVAISSGHGIGKSTFAAWIADWILSTRPRSVGMATANTGEQLRTKTWKQLSVWTHLLINAHWWEDSSADMWLRHRANKNWRIDGVTWKKEQSEAFAGQHAADSTAFYIVDEGSAVPDEIFEVAEGGLTDGEPMIFVMGNPTRASGKFHRINTSEKHRWITRQIDSRDVQITNKGQLNQWVEDYGEDSDFCRIRVRGMPPRLGELQFIPTDAVMNAMTSEAQIHPSDPVIVGVDVARGGDNESVICCRAGMNARVVPWKYLHLDDLMLLVGHVTEFVRDLRLRGMQLDSHNLPAAIFIDMHGLGSGVYDRLSQLGYPVMPSWNVKNNSDRDYVKTGDRWWGDMRDWLKAGGIIPNDATLAAQLTGRQIARFDALRSRVELESKDDMMKRGEVSPDRADALALTFTHHVAPRHLGELVHARRQSENNEDYNPYYQET